MDKHDILNIIETQAKKLSPGYVRYAKLTMIELERNDLTSFVLIKHNDLREWWTKELERVTRRETRYAEDCKQYEIKRSAWEKLTAADRKILGLRRPVKPKQPE